MSGILTDHMSLARKLGEQGPVHPIMFNGMNGLNIIGGITKRELFAAIAMHMFLLKESRYPSTRELKVVVVYAVRTAEMLLEELNKKPEIDSVSGTV